MRDCINYVILHELCHLQDHSHGIAFWLRLELVMLYWERDKLRLDGMAELMFQEECSLTVMRENGTSTIC